MDARTREELRHTTSQRRTPPQKTQQVYCVAAGLGECPKLHPDIPVELCLEATDAHGVVAPWLCDEWWIEIRARCRRQPVTVVILPTPGAILDPVIRHQLEMVRRITRGWRFIGYARPQDARHQPSADAWLSTPYDEIRFCEPIGEGPDAGVEAIHQLIRETTGSVIPAGFHRPTLCLTRVQPPHRRLPEPTTEPQAPPILPGPAPMSLA